MGLCRDARGATAAEYAIALALVALVAIGAWASLGESVDEQVKCTARAISGAGGPCEAGTGGGEGAGRPAASRGEALSDGVAPGSSSGSPGAVAGAHTSGTTGTERADVGGSIESLTAEDSYRSRFEQSLGALSEEDSFSSVSGGDGRITRDDLARVRSNPSRYDADAVAAAEFFLSNDSAMNAADVGAGRGDVDGNISLDDVRGAQRDLADGERTLARILADAADGDGGRDRQWSQDDLDALASDSSVPESVRRWARNAKPNAEGGCGWYRVDCHVASAATTAWSATSGARDWTGNAAVTAWRAGGTAWNTVRNPSDWIAGFTERLNWMASIVPPLDPRKWDEWAKFRVGLVRGVGDWLYGTGKLVAGASWWLVTDGEVDDWGRLWGQVKTGVKATPGVLWDEIDTFATGSPYEAGRAGGGLAMDGASMFVPGGALLKSRAVVAAFERARLVGAMRLSTRALSRRSPGELARLHDRAAAAGLDTTRVTLAIERQLSDIRTRLEPLHPTNSTLLYHTARHTGLAEQIVRTLSRVRGMPMERQVRLRLSALLHDLNRFREPGSAPKVKDTFDELEADFDGSRPLFGQRSFLRGTLKMNRRDLDEHKIDIKRTDFDPTPEGMARIRSEYEQMLREYRDTYYPRWRTDPAVRNAADARVRELMRDGAMLSEEADKASFYYLTEGDEVLNAQRGLCNEIGGPDGRCLKSGQFLGSLGTPDVYAGDYAIARRMGVDLGPMPLREQTLADLGGGAAARFERNLRVNQAIDAMPENVGFDEAANLARQGWRTYGNDVRTDLPAITESQAYGSSIHARTTPRPNDVHFLPAIPEHGPLPGTRFYFDGNDGARVSAVPIRPGETQVYIHGSPDGFEEVVNGARSQLTPHELAERLRANGYSGGDVLLVSCNSGACSTLGANAANAAQRLADELGATVTAPVGLARVGHGKIQAERGVWREFHPRRGAAGTE